MNHKTATQNTLDSVSGQTQPDISVTQSRCTDSSFLLGACLQPWC